MSVSSATRTERGADRAAGAPGDGALVARAAAGDERALRELYDRYRPWVYRVARGFAALDLDDTITMRLERFRAKLKRRLATEMAARSEASCP